MDGLSWSTTRAPESFSRSGGATDTLSRLASFIARADTKQHTQSQGHPQPHLLSFVCQECGKGFPYGTDLLHHQHLKHALPKPHRCPSCGQEFSLRSTLQLHKCNQDSSPCQLCHGESQPGSLCPACTSHASDPGQPQDNQSSHLLDSSPYVCALCGRGFSQKQALLHHQQAGCSEPPSPLSKLADANSLPDDSPPVSEGDSPGSDSSDIAGPSSRAHSVCCRYCSRGFDTEAGLIRHVKYSHAEELLRAKQGQKTKGAHSGGDSRKEGHTNVRGDPVKGSSKSKTKFLNCRSCELVFSSTSKLHRHRKERHSRDKIMIEPRPVISVTKRRRVMAYPCQLCGKVFLHHLSLRAHIRHTACNFTAIKDISQSVVLTAKDSTLSEDRPNKVKTSLATKKAVRAVRGRPRKVVQSKKVTDGGERESRAMPEGKEEMEEREFPCPSCVEVFSVQSQLREHVELHQSSVKRRQCSVCTSEMDTSKGPGSKRQRLYHCVPCQQGFSALDAFLEHCQEHLRVRVEEDSVMEGYTHQASKA